MQKDEIMDGMLFGCDSFGVMGKSVQSSVGTHKRFHKQHAIPASSRKDGSLLWYGNRLTGELQVMFLPDLYVVPVARFWQPEMKVAHLNSGWAKGALGGVGEAQVCVLSVLAGRQKVDMLIPTDVVNLRFDFIGAMKITVLKCGKKQMCCAILVGALKCCGVTYTVSSEHHIERQPGETKASVLARQILVLWLSRAFKAVLYVILEKVIRLGNDQWQDIPLLSLLLTLHYNYRLEHCQADSRGGAYQNQYALTKL
jgi:hypothetical protein